MLPVLVVSQCTGPPWGPISNSYLVLCPDALAWVVVLIEIVGAILTGLAGIRALRPGTETMEIAR